MLTKTIYRTALAALAGSALAACGGGDSGILSGTFFDAAVQGLSYSASPSGLSGTTTSDGKFDYKAGDTVTFKLGSITLGSVPATEQITPRTIGDAQGDDGTSAANIASNIARFLQTFDSDGNPDNGITIDPSIASAATGTVVFNKSTSDFSNDPGFTTLATATGKTVISDAQAAAHAERSFIEQLAGTWVINNGPQGKLLTLTFFTGGSYLVGGDEKDSNCANGIELGDFSYNAATATITVTSVSKDTDGSCGLGNGSSFSNVAISGNTLTMVSSDGTITFKRAETGNGIVGSWQADQPFAGSRLTHPMVVTFFSDGQYVMADTATSDIDTDPADGAAPGSERGTWSVSNNVLTSTQPVDTNGPGVGFSGLASGTTLIVTSANKLELNEPGFDKITFSRLPLTPKITVGDVAGAWYLSDPDGSTTASGAEEYVVFFQDGTYLFGSAEDDPDCYNDYANANPPLAQSTYVDGSNGSEAGHWRLGTGTGILSPYGLSFESNGSCGLYNKFAKYPENRLILSKVGTGTGKEVTAINAITWEFQDSGHQESNDLTFLETPFVLKRIPSNTNDSLAGAWVKDGSRETIIFFADGSDFTIDTENGGGVRRGVHMLASDQLTLTVGSQNCVDTISATSQCTTPAPVTADFAFNSSKTAFTLTSNNVVTTYRRQ
ncbi:MAG: hypothetical protein E6Q40_13670 [Cupriavidus sp.]|nr:MAG: hypothetical protein E6Q40_13670 [Cupriavidus sp.]